MDEDYVKKQEATIRNVLVKNLMESYVPFPLDKKIATQWAYAINVPRGGSTIIYTSYMYQMANVFKSYEKYVPTFGSLGSSKIIASIGAKLIKPKEEDIKRFNAILQNIYRIVKRSNENIGYLYEEEPYSGSLLYELGFMDEFKEYGKKVFELFKQHKVSNIITIDPHTTNTLTNLKKYIGFDIPFTPYLNLIKEAKGTGKFVLHDSCLYSRFLGMYESIRTTIRSAGVELVEDPTVTGKGAGFCCGGPVGPLNDKLSNEIAKARAETLTSVNKDVLVACPLCYANLSEFCNVKDIAEVIA
ncbi:heterodisulfide reductase chain D [Thermoplasma volcanium GSS1]|uniref:Heterodisulfide reductase chain D n=1 Tax=Thermoplasma volcanium (strain ATCC 51530 / DSM 4299 / JCM 9571 / NBRC 15438 / GSS1) TaxID=273116 RepID=Q97B65_THEVO|nr:(Fe-S)-binding protein [Thermoplasma volcanium]BAB59735.1 heterodisulfide reductase chain D [Thermoplasma volcanium GSS1]